LRTLLSPGSLRAVTAEILSERRPLPEHLQIARILGVKHSLAVAQTAKKCPSGLLTKHISVG